MDKKVVHIIGGRPQFVKCLINIRAINRFKISNVIINTGQHFDHNMSNIFLKLYPKKYQLFNLTLSNKEHTDRLAEMIFSVNKRIKKIPSSLIIIYGDTDSALAGLLVGMKNKIKIMHIESGLRSNNLKMPEEQNRIMIDHIAEFLITPTKLASKNLLKEDIPKKKIYEFGDVMYDNLIYIKSFIKVSQINFFLKKNFLKKSEYIYFSLHRESNSNFNFIDNIIKQLSKLKFKVLWPMHPKFKTIIKSLSIPDNFKIVEPLNFDNNLIAMENSNFIVTDSGGIQKEAFFLKKKVFVLRKETEWKELLTSKCITLINNKIPNEKEIKKFLNDKIKSNSDYGNGDSTLKIAKLVNKIVKQ